MICTNLSDLLGFACYPLNETGSIVMISTPFTFDDGDGMPVYVEKVSKHIRFFDDGGVMMHFLGRGLALENRKKTKFIQTIAQSNGVSFTEDGELEIWGHEDDAAATFAKYIATLMGLLSWQKDNQNINHSISFFVEEVAMCLRAWKPTKEIIEGPEYTGISGNTYRFDFKQDNEVIVAIAPHPLSVGAALKKMVDVISAPSNQGMKLTVVLDDRDQPFDAKSEGAVLGAVAGVIMMSRLEGLAGSPKPLSSRHLQ